MFVLMCYDIDATQYQVHERSEVPEWRVSCTVFKHLLLIGYYRAII